MDTVVINGVEYTKAADLARAFKYTSDYIGQLCRSRKVDAKLIGRTWYVNAQTLSQHKTVRYKKTGQSEKISTDKAVSDFSRLDVEPVIRKNTARNVSFKKPINFTHHIGWSPLKYEADEADLLPNLDEQSQTVPVKLAEAETLHISSEQNRPIKLSPEALPEVSLKGTLKVVSFDDDFEKNAKNIARTDISELDMPLATVPVKIRQEAAIPMIQPKIKHVRPLPLSKRAQNTKEITEDQVTYAVPLTRQSTGIEMPFTPRLVRDSTKAASQPKPSQSGDSGSVTVWILYLLLVVSLGVLLTLVTLDLFMSVSSTSFASTFKISLPF